MLLNICILLILLLRCCGSCGRVLEDYFFAEEPTFVKNAAGQVIEAWHAMVVFWADNFKIDPLKLQHHVTGKEADLFQFRTDRDLDCLIFMFDLIASMVF